MKFFAADQFAYGKSFRRFYAYDAVVNDEIGRLSSELYRGLVEHRFAGGRCGLSKLYATILDGKAAVGGPLIGCQ